MPTISLCMIVKNEEKVLARCLDSLQGLVDEIIIVDTGSTDATKKIAAAYTQQIYDYPWQGDFAAARNFSFSKAHMDYIYQADADEVLDDENRRQFLLLKENLLPEIEIVQMHYKTITDGPNLYNYETEYRPKLFKRLRTFTWIDPVHETVRLEPLVFDSDVVVEHRPRGNHGSRDIAVIERAVQKEGVLSPKLHHMYAMELLHMGSEEELFRSIPYMKQVQNLQVREERAASQEDMAREAACVLARAYRLQKNDRDFFTQCIKETAREEPCSEICYELGEYYMTCKEFDDAILWFYNAAYETESIVDIHAGGDAALARLEECRGLQAMI